MKGYKVLTGTALDEWESSFFFSTKEYLVQHSDSFLWVKLILNDKLLAQIIFTIHCNKAFSPFRAPYGGLEILNKVSEGTLNNFMSEVFSVLLINRVEESNISCFPNFYSDSSVILSQASCQKNKIIDKTFYYPTEELSKYNQTKRNLVNKLAKEGFYCSEVYDLETAYQIIDKQYKSKEYPLTMTLDEIKRAFIRFPNQYKLLACFDKNDIMCSAVFLVNVNDSLQYVMYNGTAADYYRGSPLVLLYDYMICLAREQNVKYIDYGIASVKGVLNKGLAFYKKSMGGLESDKITYMFNL